MKTLHTKMAALMLALVSVMGLASCSSDDDDNKTNLTTPKYEEISARYDVTSSGSDIKSIELTASGNYIVVGNTGYYARSEAAAPLRQTRIFNSPYAVTRAGAQNIIYGKFIQVSETEYILEGWGRITITGSTDDALSITVTPDNGSTYTVPVAKHTQNASSTKTGQLCRTWLFRTVDIHIKYANKTYFHKEYKMADLNNFVADFAKKMGVSEEYLEGSDEVFNEDEMPSEIIFTKSGTYMVKYNNDNLAVSTWTWENESKGVLRYSWNYSDMDDSYASGDVNISFRGNQLAVSETVKSRGEYYYEDEDDYDYDGMSVTITYYLDESK